MSRARAWAALLAALFLAMPVTAEELIDDAKTSVEANYKLETVALGSYQKETGARGSLVYPQTVIVRYEGEAAVYESGRVSRGDSVKKGDVLATVRVATSAVEYEKIRLTLERARETAETEARTRAAEIADARRALATVPAGTERQIAEKRLEKTELLDRQASENAAADIADLDRTLAELEKKRTATEIVAPIDGVVGDITYLKAGDSIPDGMEILTLECEDYALVAIENTALNFRYNMPVRVTIGARANAVEVTGRVVAADDALSETERTGIALIRLDEMPDVKYTYISVRGDTVWLDNVIAVSRSAMTMDAGVYYVTKLEDGLPRKRYVTSGGFQGNAMWVPDGLEPGDQLILD